MGSVAWGQEFAEAYDTIYAFEADRRVLDPMLDRLVELAHGGRALEFGIGTGRVGLALSARGVAVHGIELSPHMAEQLGSKAGADAVPVIIGDMTTTKVEGDFKLVYLVANALMNVTTQEEQVAVFANAAAHLTRAAVSSSSFIVPQFRSVRSGDLGRVFTLTEDHVGIETFDDPSDRSLGRTTGRRWTAASFDIQRRTATRGHLNSR